MRWMRKAFFGIFSVIRIERSPLDSRNLLNLRKARPEDVKPIFDIRNDVEVLQFFFDPTEVTFESHSRWFERVLADPLRALFVLTESETIVAVVRFDIDDNRLEAEASIYVAKTFWGRGLGSLALRRAEDELLKTHRGLEKLTAKVLSDNQASLKVFSKCGYVSKTIMLEKRLEKGRGGT